MLVPVPPFATLKGAVNVNVPDKVVLFKVGVFEKTKDPVPISFVTAEDKFELVGEAKNNSTPVPNVKAFCFAFSAAYCTLLNNPAAVPVTVADGIFKV